MSGTWWIVVCLICLLIVGYLKVRFLISSLYKDKVYALEYRKLFNQFAITFFENYTPLYNKIGNFNPELYDWLMSRSNRMQIKLGGFGLVHYTAPFNQFVVPSYRVLLNTLPKFRDKTILPEEVNLVDNALISYDGF